MSSALNLPSDLPAEAMADLRVLLSAKASDLFGLCDAESKGFVTKRDMQRMRSELPDLDPEQIESVFDTLDGDSNGYLTLEEFTEGFGAFLGLDQSILGEEEDAAGKRKNKMAQQKSLSMNGNGNGTGELEEEISGKKFLFF